MPKNITLAIDEELLEKVRVLAALKRTSVNELVRGFLTQYVEQETEYDEVTEGLLALSREEKDSDMGDWIPSRAENRKNALKNQKSN